MTLLTNPIIGGSGWMNADNYFIFLPVKKNCTVVRELTADINSKRFESYVNLLNFEEKIFSKLFSIIHFYYSFHQ